MIFCDGEALRRALMAQAPATMTMQMVVLRDRHLLPSGDEALERPDPDELAQSILDSFDAEPMAEIIPLPTWRYTETEVAAFLARMGYEWPSPRIVPTERHFLALHAS